MNEPLSDDEITRQIDAATGRPPRPCMDMEGEWTQWPPYKAYEQARDELDAHLGADSASEAVIAELVKFLDAQDEEYDLWLMDRRRARGEKAIPWADLKRRFGFE